MKDKYLLQANRLFAKSLTEFTEDYKKAIRFDTFGDAMKAASQINEQLGKVSFKVVSIYE